MKKYFLLRVMNIIITLFIIATATFFLMKQLPGSPFDEERLSNLSDDQRIEFLSRYGLDQPLSQQYIIYMKNLVTGDFGESFYFKGQEVADLIKHRIGPSALLGAQAVVLGITIGIVLGIIAAFRHNTIWDFSTMFIAVIGVSVPNFVFAALLQYYVGLKLGLLPVAFWESYSSSIMPTIALSLMVIALIARFTRNEMLEVLQQDYIITARAKGVPQFKVIYKHAIRNALIPVLTILGPIVVSLLTGSLVIENIFGVPGIGSLFVDSIKVNDYTTIMGLTLFYSAFFVLTMLIIDLLYGVIDPRIRINGAKE
ncbi:ABC transporter permease [Cytobacillus purgationiresistens]|uniref:Oligopeptide transport system permease protein n=1 Tax=Cytobacillus purgationiresistens TaxID=863449 RepID=A0ABU0AH45_9BACI|nr:ABC transporter permease [Cytobacillus purgationiresistens]MDQ0270583.1 oligopeptide transport system permease protein [Cytobacillus purgationiresistens]